MVWKLALCVLLGAVLGGMTLSLLALIGGDAWITYPAYLQGPGYPPVDMAVNCQKLLSLLKGKWSAEASPSAGNS